jgi:hypothetical protein
LSNGDAFVVDTASGNHWILNHTAAEFVECVAEGLAAAAIAERFSERYAKPQVELGPELSELESQLIEVGVLIRGASPCT